MNTLSVPSNNVFHSYFDPTLLCTGDIMSSDTDDFNEPFTLITSTVESLKSGAGGQSSTANLPGKGLIGFIKTGKDWVTTKHAGVRPWTEFLNVKSVSRPPSVGAGTSRVLANLMRFQSNYLFVFLGLVIYCM